MENIEINLKDVSVVELSIKEELSINGGSWLSYALGYLLGSFDSPEGRAVNKALHDFNK